MDVFEKYISKTIWFETGGDKSGAYHNDPDDKGGETKWGISKHGHPKVNIKRLTYKKAIEIYKNEYYNDLYSEIPSKRIAFKLFDMGVLMGPRPAVKLMQKVINKIFCRKIPVDGIYGPRTHRGVILLCEFEEGEAYMLYTKYVGNRLIWKSLKPSNSKYLVGWLRRVNYMFKEEENGKDNKTNKA